jgi:pimeloyl-ACP methyl ester carboxylesterase
MLCLPIFAGAQKTNIQKVPNWLTQLENVEAGVLMVPENHQAPTGKQIPLTYAVLKANNRNADTYPIVFFSGGPGEQSLVPGLFEFLSNHVFHQDHDLIFFDQRGIGYSGGLPDMSFDTFMVMAADADPGQERLLMDSVIQDYKRRCAEKQIDLQQYNTLQNARDVALLFEYLGYPKYNLYGGSYGTRLARVVQEIAPEKVRTSTLIAPSPLSGDFLLNRLKSYDQALGRIFDYCENNPECEKNYPNLKATYFEAIEGLQEEPLKTTVRDSIDFYINGQDGLYLIRRILYQGNAREKGPELIKALASRSGEVIQEVLNFEFQITGSINMSMLLSVEKFENFNPEYTDEVIAEHYARYPMIPVKLGYFDAIYRGGADWHKGHLPVEKRRFQPSEIPTLIFANRFDPVTPPEYGHLFMEQLSRGRLLILDEGGHGGGDAACKDRVVLDFLAHPDHALDTSCLKIYKE